MYKWDHFADDASIDSAKLILLSTIRVPLIKNNYPFPQLPSDYHVAL